MSTCKVEFKGFNIDSSSLDNYLNQFTIDGKRKIEGAKNTISYLLSNAEDNKLGVLKLALNSNKAYIKDLANMMLNTNRKFYAEVEINNNLQGFSKYNANDNKIYINVDAISQRFSESAEEYLYERIVHDFIQGFANKELKKAYSDENRDSPYMRNIINLFKEYQNITDKKQYDLFKGSIEREPLLDPRSERSLIREGFAEGTYRAITNPAEFLSYGLSSTQFRNTLRKQNLWQKFVSWLKDLLGISQDNNDLEYLYKNLDAYLKQDDLYTLHNLKSKKGQVKELTNEKQQNKTFLKYIEKHPEHAKIVTYENTGNKYVYDKQRDKVISLSTGDTIVQNDIVDKVKNHEMYEREEKIENLKKYIYQYLKDFKDMSFTSLYQLMLNQGAITHEDAHDFSEAFTLAQQKINEERNAKVYKFKEQLPEELLQSIKNTISNLYDKSKNKDSNSIFKDFMKPLRFKNGAFIFDVPGFGNFHVSTDVFGEIFEDIKAEKELEKEAKTPPQHEHSFSYKGITIPTRFKLSEEQEQALITLIENITSGDTEPITLSGYAGSGKTSIIGYLEDYLKKKRGYKFLYGAPTHAATLYLGYNTRNMPFTIASSVIAKRDDSGNVKYTTSTKVDKALSNYDQNVFVVDEVSLMDSTTMENFLSVMKGRGVKVIFMGDKMQLPEVASKGKINPETKRQIKDVSKAFTDFKLIQLSQVQRTKDNSILRILTEIRNNPNGILPVLDNTETLQFYQKGGDTKGFYKGFKEAFIEDPEETIYITYTNEDVKNFNKSFRRAIYGDDADGLVEGESVIGYSGYNNKKIESDDLANSIKYTVESFNYVGSEVRLVLKSNAVQKLANLHSKKKEVQDKRVYTDYLQLSETDSLNMNKLTEEDYKKNNERLSEIFRNVYELKTRTVATNSWKYFNEDLANITKELAKLEVGDNYFYNPYTDRMEKESSTDWNDPQMANLKKNFKELFMSKSIDYGYGITIHKAQGATYKNVFFNATSTEFARTEIHENGMQVSTEGNSLNYVAMSRASNKLFVLHSDNIKRLNNDDSIELSKNCSVF